MLFAQQVIYLSFNLLWYLTLFLFEIKFQSFDAYKSAAYK